MLQMISNISISLKLPLHLLSAICWVESHHNPLALNLYDGGSPSYGLCQIKVRTAQWMSDRHSLGKVTSVDLLKPEINALYSGLYIKYQLKRYGNLKEAISAYNAGRSIKSNKNYVTKVLKRMKHYDKKTKH